jgi:tRNA threonylcarbamoyl adenosine modification protein YeaZ
VLALAIDTSSAAVTAALVDVDAEAVRVRAEHVSINARGHGELLAPNITACLAEAGVRPGELAAIVAGLGPGPFTGLRVGLVTAAVMAELLAIPTYGVCSLDAIATSARNEGELIVATDARRKEVYWARYDASGNRVDGPHVSRAADVATGSARDMAGAGARQYQVELGLHLLGADYPQAADLLARAAGRIRAGAPSEPLTPLYLRRPDAVPPASSGKPVSQ